MKKLFSNKYIRSGGLILCGLLLGWLIFHSSSKSEIKVSNQQELKKDSLWTCSMHPHIRMHEQGKCPICGMDLIPLVSDNNTYNDTDALHLSPEAAQLAKVQTSTVTIQKAIKEIRLYGKVQGDERLLQSQVAHVPGRIEKLMVNYTGELVHRGEVLAIIYSAELINAQQELLISARNKENQPDIYAAARGKLLQLKLSESQVSSIESSGQIQNNFEVLSNTSGTVSARRVNQGDYVSKGSPLFDIADLSTVWVMFDAYESDLQFVKLNDKITFNIEAIAGKSYTGNIIYIDPVIDPVTRVAKARVEINNPDGKLKPEMFATGILRTSLEQYKGKIIIPNSAVLWTGKRSIVYVKQVGIDALVFKLREIEIGPQLGNSYVVISGLKEGEEIVTQGAFSIDAASQLEGKPSMMNPR